jgi:hypothetical protein
MPFGTWAAIRLGGIAAVLALASITATAAHAAGPPQELKWHELMPPAQPKSLKSKSLVAGMSPADPSNPHGAGSAPQVPEGRWMSRPLPPTGEPEEAAPVVESLDGKRVRIEGYIVPLDFEATRVKEFLLVKTYGACIHVPPPPANQIIYVKADNAFEMKAPAFDFVSVTGILKIMRTSTLAEAGYGLEAEKVELRKEQP